LAPSTNDFYIFFTAQQFEIFKLGFSLIFFQANSRHFVRNILLKKKFSQNSSIFLENWEKTTKISKKATKITTIAYNLEMCSNFVIFIF